MVVAFVLGHALDAPLLNVQLSGQPLDLRVRAVSILKRLACHGAIARGSDSCRVLLHVDGGVEHFRTRPRR